jgi:GNAT superfamily N-acetyltransferase
MIMTESEFPNLKSQISNFKSVPPSSITTRPATATDVPTILHFIRALAEYEKLSHEAVATEDLLRQHLFGPRPAAEVILAELDGNPVGFALFFPTYSTFVGRPGIWLEDLFVLPEARGAGVGKTLLKEVARLAVARNCGRLEWSVLDWNIPAIGFYRSIGAAPMDQWTIQRMTGDSLRQFAEQ